MTAGVLDPLAVGEADVLVLDGDVAGIPFHLAEVAGGLPEMPILMVLGHHEFYWRHSGHGRRTIYGQPDRSR